MLEKLGPVVLFRTLVKRHGVALTLVLIAYLVLYIAYPATPGNNPHVYPEGWWGWWDQSNYLRSLEGFRKLDFSPALHYYPPFYQMVGAIFSIFSTGHPYFFLDLFCTLWFCFVFLHVTQKFVSRWISVSILFAITVLQVSQFENFIIPWTTTLSVALLSVGILFLFRDRNAADRKIGKLFLVGFSLGLISPTRPLDSLLAAALAMFILLSEVAGVATVRDKIKITLAGFAGISIGPLFYIVFNYLTYGSFSGPYIQLANRLGYFPADFLEKFYSLLFDGKTLYGPTGDSLVSHSPWILLAPLAVFILLLTRSSWKIQAIVFLVFLNFALYVPFGDFLPNGLWQYKNVHYFKWTFPYLAFAIVLATMKAPAAIRRIVQERPLKQVLVGLGLILCIIFPTSTSMETQTVMHGKKIEATDSSITLQLTSAKQESVDFIDIYGLTGAWADTYFGSQELQIDSVRLRNVDDFRLVPIEKGLRLIFLRPTAVSGPITLEKTSALRLDMSNEEFELKRYQFKVAGIETTVR